LTVDTEYFSHLIVLSTQQAMYLLTHTSPAVAVLDLHCNDVDSDN